MKKVLVFLLAVTMIITVVSVNAEVNEVGSLPTVKDESFSDTTENEQINDNKF